MAAGVEEKDQRRAVNRVEQQGDQQLPCLGGQFNPAGGELLARQSFEEQQRQAQQQDAAQVAEKQAQAQKFVDWVVSPAGQNVIASYKIGGEPLFFPNATAR